VSYQGSNLSRSADPSPGSRTFLLEDFPFLCNMSEASNPPRCTSRTLPPIFFRRHRVFSFQIMFRIQISLPPPRPCARISSPSLEFTIEIRPPPLPWIFSPLCPPPDLYTPEVYVSIPPSFLYKQAALGRTCDFFALLPFLCASSLPVT